MPLCVVLQWLHILTPRERYFICFLLNKFTEKHGHGAEKTSVTKYRIRPCPDPKRKEETAWMTKEALQKEALEPSRHWNDVGSGKLGKLYVESLVAMDFLSLIPVAFSAIRPMPSFPLCTKTAYRRPMSSMILFVPDGCRGLSVHFSFT